MKTDEWTHFARKLDMLIEEFEEYIKIQSSFEKLQATYGESIKKYDDYKKQLEETVLSNKTSFGFFSKISKEDLLTSLRQKILKVEHEMGIEGKLIALIAEVMMREEIPLVKLQKRERFDEIITEFALARVTKLQLELDFWAKVLEKGESNVVYNSEIFDSRVSHGENVVNPHLEEKIQKE